MELEIWELTHLTQIPMMTESVTGQTTSYHNVLAVLTPIRLEPVLLVRLYWSTIQ